MSVRPVEAPAKIPARRRVVFRWAAGALLVVAMSVGVVNYLGVARDKAEGAYSAAETNYKQDLKRLDVELERAERLSAQAESIRAIKEDSSLTAPVQELNDALQTWVGYEPVQFLEPGLSAGAYNSAITLMESFDGADALKSISDRLEPALTKVKVAAFETHSAPLVTAARDVNWYIKSRAYQRVGTDELVRLRDEEINPMITAQAASEDEVLELVNRFYGEVQRIYSEPEFSVQPEDILGNWQAKFGDEDMEFRDRRSNSSVGVRYPNESPTGPRSIIVDTSHDLGKSCVQFVGNLVYCTAFATTESFTPENIPGSVDASEVMKLDRFMDLDSGEVWFRS